MAIFREPEYITHLKDFGWGTFSDGEIADKIDHIKNIKKKRPHPLKPEATIVVPAYKEEKHILGILLSLAHQTALNIEFIIVSNEPEGNATQRISEAAGFNVIIQEAKGWHMAHQAGLEAARGGIYGTTDADTLHKPKWVETMVQFFRDNNCVVARGGVTFLEITVGQELYRCAAGIAKYVIDELVEIKKRGAFGANTFLDKDAAIKSGGYARLNTNAGYSDGEIVRRIMQSKQGGKNALTLHADARVYTSGRTVQKIPLSQQFLTSVRYRLGKP